MTLSVCKYVVAALVLGVSAFGVSAALAGVPFPAAGTPKPVDRGLLRELAGGTEVSVTVALRLRDPNGAEALLGRLTTPGDPQFHKFLTPDQFLAKFGPADADVEKVAASLRRYGLSVERASSMTLRATGTPARLEKAFGVTLHVFEVAAKGPAPAYSFRAPLQRPKVPDEAAGLVSAVAGFDTRPQFQPRYRQAPAALRSAEQRRQKGNANTINPFGYLTVADFAQHYDVLPLSAKGATGSGRTIGIVTLANFTQGDAFTYWKALGLTVNPGRITVVNVDGGPGAPSDVSGSIETTLDVEQSGGIAPGAKIVVYMAPNTNQAFVDAFAAAIDANTADSISTSWGEWEWLDSLENAPVTDPATGKTVSTLLALHELFVKAGIQGQSMFAAAGDCGAYDVGENAGSSLPLSVDHPASDPAVTAAGGTTLPGTQSYTIPGSTTPFVINVPQERVWGEDYLKPLCNAMGLDPTACGIFPDGGGGGVSFVFPVPSYQTGVAGVMSTQPGQSYVDVTVTPPQTFSLPANYPGRNVPDVSANADPDTGYIIDYTSNVNGYSTLTFYGGTSFVAPQLNGVTALLGQIANQRLGLLNVPLYNLVLSGLDRPTAGAPLRYITEGDN
jgi:kumamolisin